MVWGKTFQHFFTDKQFMLEKSFKAARTCHVIFYAILSIFTGWHNWVRLKEEGNFEGGFL
jgi:hypothetical protein